MPLNHDTNMAPFIGKKVRVTLTDSHVVVGKLKFSDRYNNLIMTDCEEYQNINTEMEDKRNRGTLMLQADSIQSLTIEPTASSQEDTSNVPPLLEALRVVAGCPNGRTIPVVQLSTHMRAARAWSTRRSIPAAEGVAPVSPTTSTGDQPQEESHTNNSWVQEIVIPRGSELPPQWTDPVAAGPVSPGRPSPLYEMELPPGGISQISARVSIRRLRYGQSRRGSRRSH